MALAAVNITVGQSLGGGQYSTTVKGASVPDFATGTTDLATVSDDVATLVADGASPTQAHVNTLNTDFTAFSTSYTAITTAISGDVTIIWDASTITHRNQLRAALLKIMQAVEGGYGGLVE